MRHFEVNLTISDEYLANLFSGHTIRIGCAENVRIISAMFPTSDPAYFNIIQNGRYLMCVRGGGGDTLMFPLSRVNSLIFNEISE